MPFWQTQSKQRAGQPIKARDLRRQAEMVDRISRTQANPPLSIVSTAGGPLLRLAGMIFSVYIGVTNGTITARSGSTPGSGNVTLQTWDGSALASLGIDVPVKNFSSTSGGISTGVYVVILRVAGAYWIISADCG